MAYFLGLGRKALCDLWFCSPAGV